MFRLIPYFLFFIVSLVIVLGMFYQGKVISNSEESLNIAFPCRTLSHSTTIWSPVDAGLINPFNITKVPLFFGLCLVELMKIPDFAIQAIPIFLLIFSSLLGMFLLAKFVFKANLLISFISAFFYVINLFTLSQVFRRLLYSGFFAWGYLPFFILTWVKFLEEKNFKWFFYFLIASLIFSPTFGHPGFTLAVWSVGGVFILYKLFKVSGVRSKLNLLGFSLVGVIAWMLVNIWWIYPFVVSSKGYISEVHGIKNKNFELLKGVSPSFDTFQISLLRQKWWFSQDQHWGWFYQNPVIILLSLIGLLLMLYGIYTSRKKIKYFGFLFICLLLGWFISKGTNPPLGEVFFYNLFNIFPVTGSLRNSYEKFGLVFLLPYSLFFAYGVSSLAIKLKSKYFITTLIIIFFCGVLVWPFWLGSVFLHTEKVNIPPYYREANTFLNTQGSGKIFHIPHPRFANTFYNWGYSGQDPSEFLFDRKSMVNAENYPLKLALDDEIESEKLIGCLNVTNVVLHNEALEKKEQIKISKKQFLQNWNNVIFLSKIGELEVYKLNDNLIKPQLFRVSSKLRNESFRNFCLNNSFLPVKTIKQSNEQYKLTVENRDESFILVLNENYSPFWKAQVNGKNLGSGFKIFEYANGWEIKETGRLFIDVKFVTWPLH